MTIQTIPKRFKFARRTAGLFLVLSILLLVYTYYRAEIIFHGNAVEKYFKYYVISLAGILFWGVVLRLKDEIQLIIVMVATSLVVGLYLIEGSLHIREAFRPDQRLLFQDLVEQRGEGELVAGIFPEHLMSRIREVEPNEKEIKPLFPLAGLSNKTTFGGFEGGSYMIYQSDRYGFNNPDSEWDAPKTEYVLTGDSFAYGYAVNPGEDIAGQIRLMTGENAINLGMASNGPLIELATLKEYAESRKPRIVLWIFYMGDLQDLVDEKQVPLLMNYLQPEFSQDLIHRQREIDKKHRNTLAMNESLWSTSGLRLFKLRSFIHSFTYSQPESDVGPVFAEILTQARDRAAAWGGELFFVYLPRFERYANSPRNYNQCIKCREIIGVAKSLHLPVIDIHQEVFANHPDPLSLFPNRSRGHYTAEGYSKVAKAIVLGVRNEQEKLSQGR